MLHKIEKYSGVVGIVYLDENPKKFAVVTTKRGTSLPGGGIELNDVSLESAMYRELEEELGLTLDKVSLKISDVEEKFIYGADKAGRCKEETIRKVFLIKSKSRELKPKDKDVLKADWYTTEQAIKMLTWQNSKDTLEKAVAKIEIIDKKV